MQFPLDCGVSGPGVMTIISKMDTVEYDFFRVDAEYSSAYFAFEPGLYEKFESDNLFSEFKECVLLILNDVNLETSDNEYRFKEYLFWLGYDENKFVHGDRFSRRSELVNMLKKHGFI